VKKIFGILLGFVGLGVVTANASLYYDVDILNTTLGPTRPSKSGTFNIAVQGYNPDAETIDWAGFAFTFLDTDNREDTVRISLGHDIIAYENISYGFNIFGGLLQGDALLDLSADGIISYTIRWVCGDPFKLLTASLIAESTANSTLPSAPVPDGGATLAMLGLALLALEGTRRFTKARLPQVR
jgi:hypothetical protein